METPRRTWFSKAQKVFVHCKGRIKAGFGIGRVIKPGKSLGNAGTGRRRRPAAIEGMKDEARLRF